MSKNKNKQKEAEAALEKALDQAVDEMIAEVMGEAVEELSPSSLSTSLEKLAGKLHAIKPGHREIDLAVKDAAHYIEQAVSSVKFIESTQAELKKAKKK
jgi:hypothetical protein